MASNITTAPGRRPRCVRWTTTQIVEIQRKVAAANGLDPAAIPDEPMRFIDLKEVCARLSLSPASVYRAIGAGKMPKPLILDGLTRREEASVA